MRRTKRKKMMTRSAWGATTRIRQRSIKWKIYSSERRILMSKIRDVMYLIHTWRRKRKSKLNMMIPLLITAPLRPGIQSELLLPHPIGRPKTRAVWGIRSQFLTPQLLGEGTRSGGGLPSTPSKVQRLDMVL